MPLATIVGSAIELARSGAIDPGRTFFFMPTTPLACNIPQFPIFAMQAFRAAGFGDMKVGLLNFLSLGDRLPQTISIGIVEDYILACTLYKLLYRIRPYETEKGGAQRAFQAAADMVSLAIRNGGDARARLPGGWSSSRPCRGMSPAAGSRASPFLETCT